jgi:3-oxoacyl-[acyl-carrier protein] reductase
VGVLSGKVAIVTGASRGIGRAIALKLASDGARVLLVARTADAIAGAVAEIHRLGGQSIGIVADLRLADTPASVVNLAARTFGRLDIVVNNAGATRRGPFVDLTDEDWMDSFALKFFGSVRMTRAAWPYLKAAGGSVIFISGVGGRTPGPEFAAGGSVNAALLSLTKALSEQGIRDNVQVNAINPGTVRTDRLKMRLASMMRDQSIDSETAERRFIEKSNVTRIGEPEDIANLVAFVASPEGRFLQGSLIDIDGGATKTV